MNKLLAISLFFSTTVALNSQAQSVDKEEASNGGYDSDESGFYRPDNEFRLALGGSVTEFDSKIKIGSKEIERIAAEIDLEDDLRYEQETEIYWLSAGYKRGRSRFQLNYLPISRSASASIEGDIEFREVTIQAGAAVRSETDISLYDFDYSYAFFNRKNWNLRGGIGIHWMSYEIELNATGFVDVETENDVDNFQFEENFRRSASYELPLPLIGLYGDYWITKNWRVGGRARVLDVSIEDYSGRILSTTIATEYVWNNGILIGLGINRFDLEVSADTESFFGSLEWQYTSAQAFIGYRF